MGSFDSLYETQNNNELALKLSNFFLSKQRCQLDKLTIDVGCCLFIFLFVHFICYPPFASRHVLKIKQSYPMLLCKFHESSSCL